MLGALAPSSGTEPNGFVALLGALLVGAAPIAIAGSISVEDSSTSRRCSARSASTCSSECSGRRPAAIDAFGSEPFFAQEANPTSASFLYFAYVTLTTVGYGDLTASGNLGRALAVLDALVGQIYLVTVVALLVSELGRTRLTDNSDG